MLEKLLGLATIGSSLVNITLLHRFLSRVIVVIALTIVSALLSGVLIIGALYGAFYGLTFYGLAPQIAASVLALLVVIITGTLVSITINQLQKIREIPHSVFYSSRVPSISQIGSIAEAFIGGLLCRPKIKSHKSIN